MRVLLVEDDPDVSHALSEVLTDEGYSVALASNGLEGMEYLRTQEPPAVILLDLMMPVMDGYEFRTLQRAEPRFADVPVLVISAGAMDERIDAMQLAGALKKPLDLQALLDAIARCCQAADAPP
jgi:CheY-like chemotaxis protein